MRGALCGLKRLLGSAQYLFCIGLQGLRSGTQKPADSPPLHGVAILLIDVIDGLGRNAKFLGGGAYSIKIVRRPVDCLLRLLHRPV